MLGVSHARTGVCAVAVVATVGVLPWDEPVAVVLAAGLVVGGSIAPDLDHGSASVSRAFGLPTRVLSGVVQAASRLAYDVTRARLDAPGRGVHRTMTHSALGCLLLGVGLALLLAVPTSPIPGAVAVGLITGLGVHALMGRASWRRRDGSERGRRRAPRRRRRVLTRDGWKWASALGAGALVLAHPQITDGWWPWWLGAALTLGMAVHVGGDAMTDVGVPWSWPLLRAGRRWGHRWLLPAPLRFTTQHTGERVAVALVTVGTVGWCVGVLTAPRWWPLVEARAVGSSWVATATAVAGWVLVGLAGLAVLAVVVGLVRWTLARRRAWVSARGYGRLAGAGGRW